MSELTHFDRWKLANDLAKPCVALIESVVTKANMATVDVLKELQDRITALEAENADLRLLLARANRIDK